MSPLFRDSYCLYPLWNSSCSKKTHLGCKKTHGFVVYSVTHRMRPPPPKKVKTKCGKLFFWILALSRGLWRSHLIRAELSDRLFGKNNPFFVYIFLIYVYVCFVGNVAVSLLLPSVWMIISCDYSDWMRAVWMPIDRYDYMANICMIIICITPQII